VSRIIIIFLLFITVTFMGTGCGKKAAPDPPKSRTELTAELFEALGAKDHKTALLKIERLRELDPASVFLAKLEMIERNNASIQDVQELVDDGKIHEAMETLDRTYAKNPKQKGLLEAKEELRIINAIDKIVKSINNPQSPVSMAQDIVKLKKIMKTYKPAEIFAPFIKEKIEQAYAMENNKGSRVNKSAGENKSTVSSDSANGRAVFGLCSDIRILLEERNPTVFTVVAELEVEQPGHPIVRKFFKE